VPGHYRRVEGAGLEKTRGAGAGCDLMEDFWTFKRQER